MGSTAGQNPGFISVVLPAGAGNFEVIAHLSSGVPQIDAQGPTPTVAVQTALDMVWVPVAEAHGLIAQYAAQGARYGDSPPSD
jgi:hypothetical protein